MGRGGTGEVRDGERSGMGRGGLVSSEDLLEVW